MCGVRDAARELTCPHDPAGTSGDHHWSTGSSCFCPDEGSGVLTLESRALKHAACCAKSFQSCLTLYDCSPPVSSVHRILQAGILEWLALPFSRGSS